MAEQTRTVAALNRSKANQARLAKAAKQYVNGRQSAAQASHDASRSIKTAGACGISASVFKLAVALELKDQRARDRWFSELGLMLDALDIPMQGPLFGLNALEQTEVASPAH